MKKILKPETTKPQYVVTTDITYAQVDSWFGHCRRDLKLDLIYPEDGEGKTYPCIVWICGGAWQRMDKAAHLAYLGTLAQEGFVVASVEYRTSNEGTHPMQLCDIKAAIRYLRAYAKRYRIAALISHSCIGCVPSLDVRYSTLATTNPSCASVPRYARCAALSMRCHAPPQIHTIHGYVFPSPSSG